jgi:5-methylcytosine-specific restriction endonuclease McrA
MGEVCMKSEKCTKENCTTPEPLQVFKYGSKGTCYGCVRRLGREKSKIYREKLTEEERLKINKRTAEYHKKHKIRLSKMKVENARKRRRAKQDLLYEYLLTQCCEICGEKDIIVLEFDHVGTKIKNISRMVNNHSWKMVQKELKECRVLCTNCHRRRTAEQLNWYVLEFLKNQNTEMKLCPPQKGRKKKQDRLYNYLSGKCCEVCGEEDIVTLEFDHLEEKTDMISEMIFRRKWEVVQTEINKCQILCANCHKRKTAEQFDWYVLEFLRNREA